MVSLYCRKGCHPTDWTASNLTVQTFIQKYVILTSKWGAFYKTYELPSKTFQVDIVLYFYYRKMFVI